MDASLLRWSAESGEPIYRQIAHSLRNLITSGSLAAGDRLPPTRQLADRLGLNRTTVSAAYQLLTSEGFLRGHVGRGSFVASAAIPDSPAALDWDARLPLGARALVESGPTPDAPRSISFASSRPSAELFPLEEIRRTVAEVTASPDFASILQLGSPLGLPALRHYLAAAQPGARPGSDILVTSGCQQALDLLFRVLVRPGDAVAVEDPVYPGLQQALRLAGARLIALPVTAEGADPAALDRALFQDRPRLLVLTPSFQNPTGATLPLAARHAILRASSGAGVPIIENDVYSALRYDGDPIPSFRELDTTGNVIQIGSFSKIAFPGLRVGWIHGPAPVIERCAETRQWMDLHSDQLSQAVLARFAESGALERHRRLVVAAGRDRRDAALAAIAAGMPGVHCTRPEGGMNLWLNLPAGVDASDLARRASQDGVDFLPGPVFGVARTDRLALRLSFASLRPGDIRQGIGILARLCRQEFASSPDPRSYSGAAIV